MIFAFRADAEGTYSLKFNRQDFIHDIVLNDYVKVIVEAPPGTTGSPWSNPREMPSRIYAAPRWPPSPELSGDPGGEIPPSGIPAAGEDLSADRIPQPAAPGRAPPEQAAVSGMQIPEPGRAPPEPAAALGMQIPETAPPVSGDWIRRAREEYDGGRIASALAALDQFMLYYPGGSDEAYWLYGQFLEANNDATRDIRRALDYYRRLVQEYPQSSRYEEARRRIAYLERFYFNIQ
jgi:tetratricopeptide (TPR) repeat protein